MSNESDELPQGLTSDDEPKLDRWFPRIENPKLADLGDVFNRMIDNQVEAALATKPYTLDKWQPLFNSFYNSDRYSVVIALIYRDPEFLQFLIGNWEEVLSNFVTRIKNIQKFEEIVKAVLDVDATSIAFFKEHWEKLEVVCDFTNNVNSEHFKISVLHILEKMNEMDLSLINWMQACLLSKEKGKLWKSFPIFIKFVYENAQDGEQWIFDNSQLIMDTEFGAYVKDESGKRGYSKKFTQGLDQRGLNTAVTGYLFTQKGAEWTDKNFEKLRSFGLSSLTFTLLENKQFDLVKKHWNAIFAVVSDKENKNLYDLGDFLELLIQGGESQWVADNWDKLVIPLNEYERTKLIKLFIEFSYEKWVIRNWGKLTKGLSFRKEEIVKAIQAQGYGKSLWLRLLTRRP